MPEKVRTRVIYADRVVLAALLTNVKQCQTRLETAQMELASRIKMHLDVSEWLDTHKE